MDHSATLDQDEAAEVLRCERPGDYVIAQDVLMKNRTVVLRRGDGRTLDVPFDFFRPSGRAAPDWKSPGVTDHGLTISFGSYEAATSTVLYEFDAQYRARSDANTLLDYR